MTIRGVLKVFLSVLGVCLMLALWHSGAGLEAHGGWYLLAILLAVSGAMPKEVALSSLVCFLVLLVNAWLRPETDLFGLGWPHGLFCGILALSNYLLAQEDEVKVVRCRSCFWHGPATEAHFGRCPACGEHSLRDEKRTVLLKA